MMLESRISHSQHIIKVQSCLINRLYNSTQKFKVIKQKLSTVIIKFFSNLEGGGCISQSEIDLVEYSHLSLKLWKQTSQRKYFLLKKKSGFKEWCLLIRCLLCRLAVQYTMILQFLLFFSHNKSFKQ